MKIYDTLKITSFIFLLLSSFVIYSQSEIEQIVFEHREGNKILSKGHQIRISIMRGLNMNSEQVITDSKDFYTVFVKIREEEFLRQISVEKFDEICQKLIEINPKDIIENAGLYLDAATTEIRFGFFGNSVTYSVHGLSGKDEETSRSKFLEVAKLMLEVIDYKIPYIN